MGVRAGRARVRKVADGARVGSHTPAEPSRTGVILVATKPFLSEPCLHVAVKLDMLFASSKAIDWAARSREEEGARDRAWEGDGGVQRSTGARRRPAVTNAHQPPPSVTPQPPLSVTTRCLVDGPPPLPRPITSRRSRVRRVESSAARVSVCGWRLPWSPSEAVIANFMCQVVNKCHHRDPFVFCAKEAQRMTKLNVNHARTHLPPAATVNSNMAAVVTDATSCCLSHLRSPHFR